MTKTKTYVWHEPRGGGLGKTSSRILLETLAGLTGHEVGSPKPVAASQSARPSAASGASPGLDQATSLPPSGRAQGRGHTRTTRR